MRETIKQLQERWTPELTMRTIEDDEPRSPFGRLPSRLWDFRGFGDFDWRARLRSQGLADDLIVDYLKRSCIEFMNGIRFVECDFSRANFARVSFTSCTFERCIFVGTVFQRARITSCLFRDCKFHSASFKYAYLGFPDQDKRGKTVFDQCLLERCQFAGTSFGAPTFVNVVFSHCKGSFRFMASSFENVSFVGPYKALEFCNGWPSRVDEKEYGVVPPNPMNNVSFADAELGSIYCTCQCPLSHVVLPKTGRFFLLRGFWNCLLEIRTAAQNEDSVIKTELLVYCRTHFCEEGRRTPRSRFETQDEYIESLDSLARHFQPRTVSILSDVFKKYQVLTNAFANPAAPAPAAPAPHAESADGAKEPAP